MNPLMFYAEVRLISVFSIKIMQSRIILWFWDVK